MIKEVSMTCSEFVLALSNINRWGKTKVAEYVTRHGYDLEECLKFLELELTPDEFFAFNEGLTNAKIDLAKNKELGIKFISLFDEQFPKEICECKTPVVFLYYKGNIDLLKSDKKIAIIGKRENPPDYLPMSIVGLGHQAVHYLVSNYQVVVVSGLATGCDTIAHRATLQDNGKTIAVLPSSPAHIVPAENEELANEILEKDGLLISEYSVLDEMRKSNYVERDRIQSLLTKSILVIYTEEDGGAMHAVRRSIRDNKPVFALIGNRLQEITEYIDPNIDEQLDLVFSSLCEMVSLF